MKLSEYRKIANEYTAKASDITRQLSLAGIGIIWIFKNTDGHHAILEPYLVIPLLFLALGLLFDLIHYFLGGWIWINFFRAEEKKARADAADPDIKAPTGKSSVLYFFYYVKIACMLAAYIFIVIYILGKL
jgi:hypothetical protein